MHDHTYICGEIFFARCEFYMLSNLIIKTLFLLVDNLFDNLVFILPRLDWKIGYLENYYVISCEILRQ